MLEYIGFHQEAFFVVFHGLTDQQARLTPTASTLCIVNSTREGCLRGAPVF